MSRELEAAGTLSKTAVAVVRRGQVSHLTPNCLLLFWVPPRPRADVLLPLGAYKDCAASMVEFARTQIMVGVIRMGLSGFEGADFYSDTDPNGATGIHFNPSMHTVVASVICSSLELPLIPLSLDLP